jgi:Domain of unknown function (DUF4214)
LLVLELFIYALGLLYCSRHNKRSHEEEQPTEAMKQTLSFITRRPPVRESLVLLAFLGLTIIMTWPWITHLRDAASDAGDPYLNSWIMWWDYHQTFHHPFSLFQGNIFYPYRYTLAFSEHNYGVALLFFPLFALGVRPLTVHGIATLFGFAFSGYGAFRLGRTLTTSNGVAWITGIAFAFAPYRFGQLPHVNYLFAGWIPILLEALVLFLRERSWRRAAWLGCAFFMNGLTCVHWLVLTLIPLALSAVVLLLRYNAWRDKALLRGLFAVLVAMAGLAPFLLPYQSAAALYGFVRSRQEALFFSASPIDWLVGDPRNRIWRHLNEGYRMGERSLFAGLLQPLLALGAIFLVKPESSGESNKRLRRIVVLCLDIVAIISGILIVTVSGLGHFKLRVFGVYLIRIYKLPPVVVTFGAALVTRICIAYPVILRRARESDSIASLRSDRRSDGFWLGVIWALTGFFGSLGMRFYFHQALYDYVPLFRSIRVPARWAMIACLGLALLAALGARQMIDLVGRHWQRVRPSILYFVIAIALLIEQGVAPLILIHGAVDPDALAIRLKQTPMSGGIVELPTGGEGSPANYLYVLRAADHGRPLVTAVSGFVPPIPAQIQALTNSDYIPDSFIGLLEKIPCSYLVVHNSLLEPRYRLALESALARALAAGRLRFIRTYDDADLYAVTRTEPDAKSEAPLPFPIQAVEPAAAQKTEPLSADPAISANPIDDARFFVRTQYLDFLNREPDPGGWDYWTSEIQRCPNAAKCLAEQRAKVSAAFFVKKEFQLTAFFIYRVYKATLGRAPSYEEFKSERTKLIGSSNQEAARKTFVEAWVKRPQFTRLYPTKLTTEQLVDALLKSISVSSGVTLGYLKPKLVAEADNDAGRASIVQTLAEDDSFSRSERDRAIVVLQYFCYLKRDPDPRGLAFWTDVLSKQHADDYQQIVKTFIESKEYRARFVR